MVVVAAAAKREKGVRAAAFGEEEAVRSGRAELLLLRVPGDFDPALLQGARALLPEREHQLCALRLLQTRRKEGGRQEEGRQEEEGRQDDEDRFVLATLPGAGERAALLLSGEQQRGRALPLSRALLLAPAVSEESSRVAAVSRERALRGAPRPRALSARLPAGAIKRQRHTSSNNKKSKKKKSEKKIATQSPKKKPKK